MQQLDVRYLFILFPLLYAMFPFVFTGNFLFLGLLGVTSFIIGAIIFVILTSLNIGGSGSILSSGVSGNVGLNHEGTHMLFVLVIGGLFYGVTTFIDTFLNDFLGVINVILSLFGQSIGLSSATIGKSSAIFSNPANIFPISFQVYGISVFGSVTVIMGLLYILGMWFFISSRGN